MITKWELYSFGDIIPAIEIQRDNVRPKSLYPAKLSLQQKGKCKMFLNMPNLSSWISTDSGI